LPVRLFDDAERAAAFDFDISADAGVAWVGYGREVEPAALVSVVGRRRSGSSRLRSKEDGCVR